jgi:hypothetical protein
MNKITAEHLARDAYVYVRRLEMQRKYQVGLRLYRDGIGHFV